MLSSLGIQKTCQRKAQLKAQASQLPWRWSQRPSAKWHLAKQPDHQVLSLRCWSPLGLKLTEQVMKVLERVVEGLIRQRLEIDEMQCGFMSGRGTTDAIFIVRQLQEKHLAANKPLYMAFVDLEKAFDRVPRDVIWWAMRKLGIDEWLVRLVQSMYKDVRSRVRVGDGYSEEFGVGVGVHQGSVLSPLLFIIVLEALSREFLTGCPWELLYADDGTWVLKRCGGGREGALI